MQNANLYTKAWSLVDSKFTEQAKEGAFSGYAAATGNVDLGSDIILKGAFSDWLKQPMQAVCVCYGITIDRPIGKNISMSEDDKGDG